MEFVDILQEMASLYHEKNHDYGNSFEDSLNKFGILAGVIRMNDKMNRINNLVLSKDVKVKDEKIEDTLIDLANYAAMTLKWMKNNERI